MGTRKTFSKEFKLNAVRMITGQGHKASEVARDLGIHENLIYLWKRKYIEDQQESFPGKGKLKSRDEYVRNLEK